MRICIDSNQFIFGISGTDSASEKLMLLLPQVDLVLPRLIIKEVTRNIDYEQSKVLYALLNKLPHFTIIDEAIPIDLIIKYTGLGLPEKADALIGAFVEWQNAQYLISDNRHFLSDLHDAAFEVLTPVDFIQYFKQ